MFNSKSDFSLVALGFVAKDKIEDDNYIDVYPAELQPGKNLELSEVENKNDIAVDKDGNIDIILNTKSTLIKAKWIPFGGDNQLGAPDVCKGEKVLLFKYSDLDQYYWSIFENDLRLRKNEKKTIILSNRPHITKDGSELDKVYYITIDTINKFIRLHTDDSDGELCVYDIELNTKEGTLTILDGLDNEITLDSEDGSLTINTNSTVITNTPKAVVNCEISTVTASDTVDITATNNVNVTSDTVNVTGSKSVSVTGNSSVSVKSDNVSVKGSGSVSIDGGSVAIKGSVVTIN